MSEAKNKPKSKPNTTKPASKTVSGLPPSGLITNIYSACVGLSIFVLAPYIVNKYNNTLLANVINIFPTGITLMLFIREDEFKSFYFKLLFVPCIFVVLNWILYYFYEKMNMTPLTIIAINLGVWFCLLIYSLIYG